MSPYLAEYDEISTWIILQYDLTYEDSIDKSSLMPVIRLFKNNILVELGSNFDQRHLVTFMYHL